MAVELKDPRTQKIILLTIVAIAALYAYFLTDLAPFTYKARAAQIGELSGRYQKLSQDLTKARQAVNSLPYLEREYELLHQKWQRAARLLPDEQEMASLLRAIAVLGERCDVRFLLFRPLPPQQAQFHTEHGIDIKVEGGYHEIGAFLSELANMERILTVSSLTIEGAKKSDAEKPAIATFVAKTYTLGGSGIPPEEAARAAKAAKGAKGKLGIKGAAQKAAGAKQRGVPSDE